MADNINDQIAAAYQAGDIGTVNNLISQANMTADQANSIWGSGIASLAAQQGVNFAQPKSQVQAVSQTPAQDTNYANLINQAYANIGRTGIGSATSNIDQGGFDYWKNQLASGALTPENFNAAFNNAVVQYEKANPNDVYTQYVQNYQLGQQADPIKTAIANIYQDNQISIDEANQVQAYQDKYNFTPAQIAQVTGKSVAEVNNLLGARNKIISNVISQNVSNPLALADFATQNGLTAKQMADASGGKLTAEEAQYAIDKSNSYTGRLELSSPDAYNQIKNVINRAVNKDYGGQQADWMYEMFGGLDPKITSGVLKQLEMTTPTTQTVQGYDENNNPYTYNKTIAAQAKDTTGLTIERDEDGNIIGYSKPVTSSAFDSGANLTAHYDLNGQLTGYDSRNRIYVSDPQWYGAKWDPTGKATPVSGYTGGGGWLSNTIQDLGPIGQIGLAIATDGMSLETQIASQAAYQMAGGVPADKALTNALASYAGVQAVNIPVVKDIISNIDNSTLQSMVKGGLSSAASAGVLGKDVASSALAGLTGGAVSGVVSNLTKDLDLTPKQSSIFSATAGVFAKAKLAGASDDQALQAAIQAGGLSTAKTVVKALKEDKSADLGISDDTVANLDKFQYDPTAADQVIKAFQLASSVPSADPGVDVAGPGGEAMASISGMKPMLGVPGETSGKIGYNSTEGRYERDITGITKDGKEYSYKAYYYDDPIKGSNVWYAIPGGNISDPNSEVVISESRTRPTFDTDATSTDVSTMGVSTEPLGGTTTGTKSVVGGLGTEGTEGKGTVTGSTSVGVGSGTGTGGTGVGGTGTGGTGTGTGGGTGISGDGGGTDKTEVVTKTDTTAKTSTATATPTSKKTTTGPTGLTMPQATQMAAAFGVPNLANVFYYGKDFSSFEEETDEEGKLKKKKYKPLSVTKAGAELPDIPEESVESKSKSKDNNVLAMLEQILGRGSEAASEKELQNIVKGS